MKLRPRRVEKPWGRADLPDLFGPADGSRIGEIWFEPADATPQPLLAKYLFTSDRLSVQVHPGAVKSDGLPACAKNECWYVVEAHEGAQIGLGLRRPMTAAEARQAALDGSIENELDWRPVLAGDFIFVPAGTIHSIGAGLTIVELQQNCDVTYRLFDFGRPRDLQLDAALAVARLGPFDPSHHLPADGECDRILISVPEFTVARVSSAEGAKLLEGQTRWVLPVRGSASVAGQEAAAGECLLAAPGANLFIDSEALVLVAAAGEAGAPIAAVER